MLNKEINVVIESFPDDNKMTVAAIIHKALKEAGVGLVSIIGAGENAEKLNVAAVLPTDALSKLTVRMAVVDTSRKPRRVYPARSHIVYGDQIQKWIEDHIRSAVRIWTKNELLCNLNTRQEHRQPVGQYCLVSHDNFPAYCPVTANGEAMSLHIYDTTIGKSTGLFTFRFRTLHQTVDNKIVHHLNLIMEATAVRGVSPIITRDIVIESDNSYLRTPEGHPIKMPDAITCLVKEIVAI